MSGGEVSGGVGVVVTAPPYAPFLDEVARHPLVVGLRLNTVMPVRGGPKAALERLAGLGPPLWVDLKARQLRVAEPAIPPFTSIRLSHRLSVRTPVDAWLGDGRERARVAAVDGDRLILEDGPRRLVGPGESINIPDPSLEVEGNLTELDRAYLEAMKALGLDKVMLSFVEGPEDPAEVRALLPGAEILLKIESLKGLAFAREHGAAHGRLMAARGDLYVEVGRPHAIIGALRDLIAADPEAWAASRLFPSLVEHPVPASPDLGDLAWLLSLGYRRFLLGDEVCLRRDSVIGALNLFQAVVEQALGDRP
jgi:pyruvate kinase